jgi:hypothetical protein
MPTGMQNILQFLYINDFAILSSYCSLPSFHCNCPLCYGIALSVVLLLTGFVVIRSFFWCNTALLRVLFSVCCFCVLYVCVFLFCSLICFSAFFSLLCIVSFYAMILFLCFSGVRQDHCGLYEPESIYMFVV